MCNSIAIGPQSLDQADCSLLDASVIMQSVACSFQSTAQWTLHSAATMALLQFLDEADRSLHDAIMIVRRALKNSNVVAGGGAIDMELSKALRWSFLGSSMRLRSCVWWHPSPYQPE